MRLTAWWEAGRHLIQRGKIENAPFEGGEERKGGKSHIISGKGFAPLHSLTL